MAKDDREERRAAALRANLRRRKGQARQSVLAGDTSDNEPNAGATGDQRRADDPVS